MREILESLVAELTSHPSIEVEEAFLGDGLTQADIDAIAGVRGLRLAVDLCSLYREVNGAFIRWHLGTSGRRSIRYRSGAPDEPVYGSLKLSLLEEIVLPTFTLSGPVWEASMSQKSRRQLASFRTLEENVEEARVGVMSTGGTIQETLYYVRQGYESILEVDAGLDRYLSALRQSRGFYWWQEVFTLRPAGLESSPMKHYIPQLFPDERFSEFHM